MYFLSGGPSWSPEDCAKMFNSTTSGNSPNSSISPVGAPGVNRHDRTFDLTSTERGLLTRPLRQVAGESVLMRAMDFLRDSSSSGTPSNNNDRLDERFSSLAPMAQ